MCNEDFIMGVVDMKKLLMVFLAGLFFSAAVSADEGHHFGKWPAINAVIAHQDQKALDLGDADMLLEIWFKPLPLVAFQHDSPPFALISKKGPLGDRGYKLSYYHSGALELQLSGDEDDFLERDLVFSARSVVKYERWNYAAATLNRAQKRVRLYVNGKMVKEFKNVTAGRLDCPEAFSIAFDEYERHSQALCRIREARVWKFSKGLPAKAPSALSAHAGNPVNLSRELTKAPGVQYSRWKFADAGRVVKDAGNNSNTLFYSPLSYSRKEIPPPETVSFSGRKIYVNRAHANASDKGRGAADKPFMTIIGALKTATPGDTVIVRPGLYRESISIPGGLPDKPVTVQGEKGAVITGADKLEGWRREGPNLWIVKDWKGGFQPPAMPEKDDARSHPGNLLFVNDRPMEYVAARGSLVPGSWTIFPLKSSKGRTILLYPLPGLEPTKVPVEISVRPLLVKGAGFAHIKGMQITRAAGIGLRTSGRGWLVEDTLIDWCSWSGLIIYGQDHVVRRNSIYWNGCTGVSGSSIALRFLDNRVSFCAWRPFNPNWHGGAVKLIPANLDHVFKGNTVSYNAIRCIWYDAYNEGNLIEDNIVYDNADGLFDEIGFGNTWRNNLCYNNRNGIVIGESNADKVHRNIFFNNFRSALGMRGSNKAVKNTNAREVAEMAGKLMGKLDVRRYQGMIEYEREKRFRKMFVKYWAEYVNGARDSTRHNELTENVVIANREYGLAQPLRYHDGKLLNPDAANTYNRNIYWSSRPDRLINMGGKRLTLEGWQKASAQDAESVFRNPFKSPEKMPAWFTERFKFKENQFRSDFKEILKATEGVRSGVPRQVILGRIFRSKTLERVQFESPGIRGVYFDFEGKRTLALWNALGVDSAAWIIPDAGGVVVENHWMQRKPLSVKNGLAELVLGPDPVTLIGVKGKVKLDNSCLIDIPAWNDPDKRVPVVVNLNNPRAQARKVSLAVITPAGWKTTKSKLTFNLKPGEKKKVTFELAIPPETRRGAFRLKLEGAIDSTHFSAARGFSLGTPKVIAQSSDRSIKADGDLSHWGLAKSLPNGLADRREQVLYVRKGKKWGGRSDLSARVWMRWERHTNLHLAFEVTDDVLVVNPSKSKGAKTDSVEFFMDVRPAWKHFMDDYSLGVFHLVFVPGNDAGSEPVVHHVGAPFARIYGLGSKRTRTGYIIEVNIHFRSGNIAKMKEAWKVGRRVRVGVLINDSDNAGAPGRKLQMGVWRTTSDAPKNCNSWTPFVLVK